MKKTPFFFYLSLLFIFSISISLSSCQSDTLFDDIFAENADDDIPGEDTPTEEDDNNDGPNPEGKLDISTTPCDYTLDNVVAGAVMEIECKLDLDGATIDLPSDVTFIYKGGEIINGTLNFDDGGKIDGNLLNYELKTEGSVSLIEEVFQFYPERWEIAQGVISDDIATQNRELLETYFVQIKNLTAKTFLIDEFDAYFKYDGDSAKGRADERALNLPGDFHLLMTDNTHLRLQPNNHIRGSLLALLQVDNVTIEGGNLYGDRDTHDYSDGETHAWGHTLRICGSKNVTIKDVNFTDAAGDGIAVYAFNHAFASTYRYSDNVLITKNTILRARRNGISLTDGKNVIIENNELLDSGISTAKTDGVAPMWAIDIEPIWGSDDTIKYEIVENVIIRNNIEKGSQRGGIINARGDNILYENNTMENKIVLGQTRGSIIRNNTFANPGISSNVAIYAGSLATDDYGDERNSDNQVYGNTITGFPKGIFVTEPELDLHDNVIINCESGIQILRSRDSKIRDNTIINEIGTSEGIGNKTITAYINNVDIYNNTIKVKGSPFRFTNVNLQDSNRDFKITIRDNDLTSIDNQNSSFNQIRGFDFNNNICSNSGIRTKEASEGNISDNIFENGIIRISEGCSNLSFLNNTITGGNCFNDDNTDAVNIVKDNNSCN